MQTECQAGGFAPRPPGVQPTGGVADAGHEGALARVVRLAICRVVADVGDRGVIEDHAEQRNRRVAVHHTAVEQIEDMSDIGQVEAVVQHLGALGLVSEPGAD